MRQIIISFLLIFNCLITKSFAATEDPILTVTTPNITKKFTRSQLLRMPTLTHIEMANSRAYPGININFTAIKLCDILQSFKINPNATVEFISTDHFYALVPAQYILNCSNQASLAYLAIETKNNPWPRLHDNNADKNNPNQGSAGPFKVIWLHPEKSYISNEYWAWNLSEIKVHALDDAKNVINPPDIEDTRIHNGYNMYLSRCSACHSMNGIGKGKIGTDLNTPVSAVTRFKDDDQLKKFIRDPQSVRPQKNGRMSGSDEKSLTNADLNDLILYLHYMEKHRQ